MRRFVVVAVPVFVLSLAGCGSANRAAEVATLSQEQLDAEEKHHQDVSIVEKQREKLLPKAIYVPLEEAVVNDVERKHEAALREAARAQKKP